MQIPGLVCGTDPRHSDLAAAQASGGGDWLVLRLQLLVDMGFKMASGQLEVSVGRWMELPRRAASVVLSACHGEAAIA